MTERVSAAVARPMVPETRRMDMADYDGPRPRMGRRPDTRRLSFEAALRRERGNLMRTADRLGISRKTATLWYRDLLAGTLTKGVEA